MLKETKLQVIVNGFIRSMEPIARVTVPAGDAGYVACNIRKSMDRFGIREIEVVRRGDSVYLINTKFVKEVGL